MNHLYIFFNKLSHKEWLKRLINMDELLLGQQINYKPEFILKDKSVYFTCTMQPKLCKLLKLKLTDLFKRKYNCNPSNPNNKSFELEPTKYESYIYMDLGDNEDDFIPVCMLLGFYSYPSRNTIQIFKFGHINIEVTRKLNECNEPFFILRGNTTRKVLNLIKDSLFDIKDWIKEHKLKDKIYNLYQEF